MEQTTDVERLFSWLRTQDLRYREFTAQRDIADAVATWPALHKAAEGTGLAGGITAPVGDAAAKERLAREQTVLPAAAEAAGSTRGDAMPAERLVSALEWRRHASRAAGEANDPRPVDRQGFASEPAPATSAAAGDPGFADPDLDEAAARERAREAAERLRDRLDAAMAVNPRPVGGTAAPSGRPGFRDPGFCDPGVGSGRADDSRAGDARAGARRGLFSGAYHRAREDGDDDAPPPEQTRRSSSLQAVFSRLSASQNRALRDPRARSRGMPGRNPPFGRAR